MNDQKYKRVLYINLTDQSYYVDERKDLFELIGGVGIGVALLNEHMNPSKDPLHEDQSIIFSIGPMETIFPAVTKVAALFISPLTGELGESYAGMRLGLAMRFSGYDSIVIKGSSKKPIVLYINKDIVNFHNGEALWGTDISESGRLMRKIGDGEGLRSIIRIGEAGEQLVSFANVNVDTYRHFGRLGLGALFGSKHLKGIIIHGDHSSKLVHNQEFLRAYDNIYKKFTETDLMEKYHGVGTSINIKPLNEMNALPTLNLKQNNFEKAEEICGEAFIENYLTRKMACAGCPIGCIHLSQYRFKFGDPHEYAFKELSYDYELIFSLGSFLGIGDIDKILILLDAIEEKGLDGISTGILMGWATEAQAHNLLSQEQLGCQLIFGEHEGYIHFINQISKQNNEVYRELAKGTYYASNRFGGFHYASVLGTHEIAGYHTGYGNLLGMTVGARHSHLDNGGYAIDQKMDHLDKEKIVDDLINEEIERNIQNCLVICLFARNVYDFNTIISALETLEVNKSREQLYNIGESIFKTKVLIKQKLGFSYQKQRFPERFFETPTPFGKLDREIAEELLELYSKKVEEIMNNESIDLFKVIQANKTFV